MRDDGDPYFPRRHHCQISVNEGLIGLRQEKIPEEIGVRHHWCNGSVTRRPTFTLIYFLFDNVGTGLLAIGALVELTLQTLRPDTTTTNCVVVVGLFDKSQLLA